MSQRDQRLDVLRVLSAFAVVCVHASGPVVADSPDVHSPGWWTANAIDAFSRWCVPVFVMISGALLLSSSRDSEPLAFYRKRASRLLPPLVFWSLAYLLLRAYLGSTFSLKTAAVAILTGQPYSHMWFLYMLVGLYFATPFLRMLVSQLRPESLGLLIVGCFAISAVEAIFGDVGRGYMGTTFLPLFLPYIGYFLAGHYLLTHDAGRIRRLALPGFLLCGILVAAGTGLLLPALGAESRGIMYSYLNPLVIVMSLCVFLFVMGRQGFSRPLPGLEGVAKLTLGVYLIHPFWLSCLRRAGITGQWVHPAVGIPFTALLVFALSFVSVAAMARIPYLRRTVC